MANTMMDEEKAELTAQELELMEQEARAMEEADARAVAQARAKKAARKRKARIRKLIIFLAVIAVAGLLAGSYYLKKQAEEAAANALAEVTCEEGQTAVYAQITEVYGNEVTYTVLQEIETEAQAVTETEAAGSEMPGGEAAGSEMPSGDAAGSEMPGGDGPSGGMPDGDSASSEAAGGMPGGGMGGMQMGGMGNESEDETSRITISGVTYELTDESITVQIPVGTDVITKLGSTTTFAKLSVGDNIAFIMEDDQIVKIYIVE
ncbi:MAG: hypothetical protein K6G23_05505 [Lachnospiraceae bacterium]|nr:hypothetical protein [Lachnospiraceae bacterium]